MPSKMPSNTPEPSSRSRPAGSVHPAPRTGPVAFVLKGYPRLSETFIAQEIRGLERAGLDIRVISLRQPTDPTRHPVHDEIQAPVTYLPEYLHREPVRVWRGWRAARRQPGYREARRIWLRDLGRDFSRNRIRRFGQALVLAAELPKGIGRLHAHFLHTPASVTRYAATLAGLPWSCSAHAKDIWTTAEWEKREKLASATWLVTCSRFGAAHLSGLAPDPATVELVYHGLDFDRFEVSDRSPNARNGATAADTVELLSVGRAVGKKGYEILLRALADLPNDLHWRLVHIGGGPLLRDLQDRAGSLGIADRISWRGPQPFEPVLAAYRSADVFVLAARITPDGDRDGLPNVLLEAQSQSLPCVSTLVSGIPELVEDDVTGLLVPPDDADAMAGALERMIREPTLRTRLGDAGSKRVRARFDHRDGLRRLAEKFGLTEATRYGESKRAAAELR